MRFAFVRSPFTWTICLGVVALVAAVLVPRAFAAQPYWYSVPGMPQSGPVSCYTDPENYFFCRISYGGQIRTSPAAYRNFNDVSWRYTPDNPLHPYWTYGSAIYTNSAGSWVERVDETNPYDAHVHLGPRNAVKAMCALLTANSHWNDFDCYTTVP
jgi:hypothetical protein